jgi:hypothetical protein
MAGCDDPRVKTRLLLSVSLLGTLSALSLGCGGANVKAETRVGADVEVFDFDRPMAEEKLDDRPNDKQQQKTVAALSASGNGTAQPSSEAPLLGARHDLRLAPSVTKATCQCLAAVAGSPTTAGLSWMGPTPRVDGASQLVVAIGSEGIACPNNPKDEIASYRGYAVEGGDVVITVETAQSGRPVTHGAIIPRPAAGGQVYVRPAGKQVPFGRALQGNGSCALGVGGS